MNTLGFFSDTKLQEFAASMSTVCTAFIETGAEEGMTTRWAAEHFRSVFTCEIDPKYMAKLWDLPSNVQFSGDSSPRFLQIISRSVGKFPLIFLDAHWMEYWPLLDELRAISQYYARAVIIVHDCLVPNRPNFWACRGGGGDNDGPLCEWEYIKNGIVDSAQVRLFYPNYDAETPGYCVIFKDCEPQGDLRNLTEYPIK